MLKIHVKSLQDTFRRAGFAFNRAGRMLDLDTLTQEQLDVLRREPRLVVTEVADDPDAGIDSGEADAAGADAPMVAAPPAAKKTTAAKAK